MSKNPSNPIFIHSLWRSGSTYIFSVFRRSAAEYYCYQEPVHEAVLLNKDTPEKLLELDVNLMAELRHPILESPYFQELYDIRESWSGLISKPIIYDEYFGTSEALTKYLKALIDHSKARPVIQECHTSNRLAGIKKALGGTHLYLWRNPWDQWWSYKSTNHFDITSQLILNTPTPPDILKRVRGDLGFSEFHDEDIAKELAHFDIRRLSAENSYLIFYLVWCLGLIEGQQHADLLINIDSLTDSTAYRNDILASLSRNDITGIDFSDCKIPQAYFTTTDKDFFSALEEKVHGYLLVSGYTQKQIDGILALRRANEPEIRKTAAENLPKDFLQRDAERARKIVLRYESLYFPRATWRENVLTASDAKAAELQAKLQANQAEVQRISAELAERAKQVTWLDGVRTAADTKATELQAKLQANQAEMQRISALLSQQMNQKLKEQESWWRSFSEREREFSQQLLALQQGAEREKHQLSEQLNQRIALAQDELRKLEQSSAARERVHAQQIAQVRQEQENLLRSFSEREREFSQQLLVLRQEAEQERLQLSEQLSQRLEFAQDELRRQEQSLAARERVHSQQIEQARQHQEGLLRSLSEREREYSEQLQALQQDAEREKLQLSEQLNQRIALAQDELRRHEQSSAARELVLTQQAAQVQQERENLLLRLSEREREYSRQLQALRKEVDLAQEELSKQEFSSAAREKTLNEHIASILQVSAALQDQMQEERQTIQRISQTLAETRQQLAMTHSSFSWKVTTPLRKLGNLLQRNNKDFPGGEMKIQMQAGQPEPRPAGNTLIAENQNLLMESAMSALTTTTMDQNAPIASHTLDELMARHDAAFVISAYRTLLGRAPDPEGLRYYLDRLRQGFPKIHLLAQLRSSAEGKDQNVNLPKLDREIQRYQRTRIPLIGWIFKLFSNVESGGLMEEKLRRIENQLYVMSEESNQRFIRVDNALAVVQNQVEQIRADLHNVVANQTQSVISALNNTAKGQVGGQATAPIAVPTPPSPATPSKEAMEELKQLGPHAQEVYSRLQEAKTLIKQGG